MSPGCEYVGCLLIPYCLDPVPETKGVSLIAHISPVKKQAPGNTPYPNGFLSPASTFTQLNKITLLPLPNTYSQFYCAWPSDVKEVPFVEQWQ